MKRGDLFKVIRTQLCRQRVQNLTEAEAQKLFITTCVKHLELLKSATAQLSPQCSDNLGIYETLQAIVQVPLA
ncbi:MAG: hypothetical protein V4732_04995 [Pseudomonadota bacterium]